MVNNAKKLSQKGMVMEQKRTFYSIEQNIVSGSTKWKHREINQYYLKKKTQKIKPKLWLLIQKRDFFISSIFSIFNQKEIFYKNTFSFTRDYVTNIKKFLV